MKKTVSMLFFALIVSLFPFFMALPYGIAFLRETFETPISFFIGSSLFVGWYVFIYFLIRPKKELSM